MGTKRPRKQQSLAELTEIYYKKLKDSGFEDIEKNEYLLKTWSTKFSSKQTLDRYEAKEEYFRLARHFLNDYQFSSELEKAIWTYHSEGLSHRNIAQLLNDAKLAYTNKDAIMLVVRRLKEIMKKIYLGEQQ